MAVPAQGQQTLSFNPKNPSFASLTATELSYAHTAWAYFAQNTDPQTGLVPSVRNFKSMTLWDQGAYLLATVSAYKLRIITRDEASGRMFRTLDSVAKFPLYRNQRKRCLGSTLISG